MAVVVIVVIAFVLRAYLQGATKKDAFREYLVNAEQGATIYIIKSLHNIWENNIKYFLSGKTFSGLKTKQIERSTLPEN